MRTILRWRTDFSISVYSGKQCNALNEYERISYILSHSIYRIVWKEDFHLQYGKIHHLKPHAISIARVLCGEKTYTHKLNASMF